MSEYKREAISPLLRYYIMNRDGFVCRYCGHISDGADLYIEHIEPVSNGGTDHRCNLALACGRCHLSEHSKVDEGFIQREHARNIIRELAGWGHYRDGNADYVPTEYRTDVEDTMLECRGYWMEAVEMVCMITNCFIDRVKMFSNVARYLSSRGEIPEMER